jgi:hypothetical protein
MKVRTDQVALVATEMENLRAAAKLGIHAVHSTSTAETRARLLRLDLQLG